MQKLFLVLFFIIILSFSVNALIVINEIMYNPVGDENNEFVEIYYDSWINLSGYMVEDLSSSDILKEVKVENNSNYALIVENSFDFSGINSSVYTIGSSIGSGLNNDGDLIILRNNKSKIIDLVYYSDDWGGDGNGFSLERIDINENSNDKDNWKDSLSNNGTPGNLNSVIDSNACDWNIFAITNGDIFNSSDFEFKVKLEKIKGENKQNFTIKRKIVNSENKIVKDYENLNVENVLNSKTLGPYSPNLDGNDVYYVNASIVNLTCNDNNLVNNEYSKLIFIKEDNKIIVNSDNTSNNENKNESRLQIVKVSDEDNIKFGGIIKVKIDIYKGDTKDNSIKLYVEDSNGKDVSEISSINIFGKFKEETITLPLILKEGCNSRYGEGEYDLVLTGLDKERRKKIIIKDDECNVLEEKKINLESNSKSNFNVNTQRDLESDSSNLQTDNSENQDIEGKVIYESKAIRASDYGLYFLISTLIILIFYLLLKKGL